MRMGIFESINDDSDKDNDGNSKPEAVVDAGEAGAAQAPPRKLKPDRKYPLRSSTVLVTCSSLGKQS